MIWYNCQKTDGDCIEIRDEEAQSKKEDLGKDQPETPGGASCRIENAQGLGMVEEPEKVRIQQGVHQDDIRHFFADQKTVQIKNALPGLDIIPFK